MYQIAPKQQFLTIFISKIRRIIQSAASIWGRLVLQLRNVQMRLLFEGGFYLSAASNTVFTVYACFEGNWILYPEVILFIIFRFCILFKEIWIQRRPALNYKEKLHFYAKYCSFINMLPSIKSQKLKSNQKLAYTFPTIDF